MDDSPEVIRQQMEETRASLSEKLETLEQQVVETVHEAKAAVTDTVSTVKEAVHETVESVKETFDLSRQVQRHPWAMLGGSLALGYLSGMLFERLVSNLPSSSNGNGTNGHGPYREPAERPFTSVPSASMPRPEPANSNGHHSLLAEFEPEIAKLKGMAVGATLSMVRDMITGSIPESLKPDVSDVMNNLTVKLGGKPIRGEVLKAA
jgi:ElaB/YqjD/DUF883 family membrane-anchored ribosome-binding protein